MKTAQGKAPFILAILLFAARPAAAAVKMPAIFGDHMVLQDGRKVPFWGSADPGERVVVTAGSASGETTADAAGRWKVELGPLTEAAPFTVTVKASNTLTFADVVVGEVWVASGQSNMEWTVSKSLDGDRAIEEAHRPELRLFRVPLTDVLRPEPTDVNAHWEPSTPSAVAPFSGVGYFFGRTLQSEIKRPVGIIQAAWGGTPAEAWTSRKALAANASLRQLVKPWPTSPPEAAVETQVRYVAAMDRWSDERRPRDPGNTGEALGFAAPAPRRGWPTMVLPHSWESAGLNIDGVVWFRRRVFLPEGWAGQALTLRLGRVGDCDVTYVNGVKVGSTCTEVPRHSEYPRRYAIPAALTKGDFLLVAVRVFDGGDNGGIYGEPDSLRLSRGEKWDDPSISLAGEWAYHVEKEMTPLGRSDDKRPAEPSDIPKPGLAGVLYDNMLAPLIPYGIRGAIWYQGESNTKRADQYRTLFPTMIRDWRAAWGQGDFPFLFVQLAGFHSKWPGAGQRSEDEWAELREAQAMTLELPQTGMAVACDIGNRDDIHPRNKLEVARRLSLIALAKVYGREVEHAGPMVVGHAIEKDKIRVKFAHAEAMGAAGTGSGEGIMGFEVAGRDRRFVAAAVKVEGDAVVLSAPNVPKPMAARYSWTDAPVGNLVNKAGLPAAPFRTDKWPGITVGRK